MKILYVATIAGTMRFFPEHFKMLISEGHTIEIAANTHDGVPQFCTEMGLKIWDMPFSRSPLAKGNFLAIKKIKELVKTQGYDIVHVHTPNAAACTRLACRKLRKKGLKVFYTAHGFHFYKGAPLKNWLIYYPVEWLCAHWTDTLITINQEDYARAQKHMHAKKVVYVPGVGIDLNKFGNVDVDKKQKREELGIPEDAKLLISVGELNENKNHETVIKAINGMDVYYIIAGVGNKRDELQALIDSQGMTDRIKLLGFRTDVKELYAVSDMFVFPSFREGLSVSVMEAMATGLPCVVSKIRGNTDLVDENGGALFDPHSCEECSLMIKQVIDNNKHIMSEYNQEKICQFSSSAVKHEMSKIYKIKQ